MALTGWICVLQITVLQAEVEKSPQTAAAQAATESDWEQQYGSVTIDEEELDKTYRDKMFPLMFGQVSVYGRVD